MFTFWAAAPKALKLHSALYNYFSPLLQSVVVVGVVVVGVVVTMIKYLPDFESLHAKKVKISLFYE